MALAARLHVVAAAVFREATVLVAKRLPGGRHGGLWEFPGGKVEAGEDPRAALARELAEELGITASVGEPLASVEWDYPERSILLDVYRCEIADGEPEPRECAEVAWVTGEELRRLAMPEADVDVVMKVGEMLVLAPKML